ncbi:hypothetical protein HWV62_14566 [Athelia sp. TMB]|nr:hypothetical protein HWV62_42948 [Athelia sp. TMB]KAF7984464.1 hypothetical protein HWV62_14566 [Athelia sp. TMB]
MNSDKIRGEWLNFETWNNAMKAQEETKLQRDIQELTTVMERKLATQRWQSSTSMAINQDYEKQTASLRSKMEEQVSSKAREEWHARLERAGLSMEQWTDITSAENAAVAAIEWGAAPKVREFEFDADESCGDTESILSSESSQSKTPTPSIASSRGPQLWTPPETSAELPRASQVPFPPSVQLDNPPPGLRATFTRPDATVPHGPNIAFNGTSSPHTSSPQMSSTIHLPTPRVRNVNLKEDRNVITTHVANIMDTHTPRSSWADDATLPVPSQNTTDDESNDQAKKPKAPTHQRVQIYKQWIPPPANEPPRKAEPTPRSNNSVRPRSRTMSSVTVQSIPMSRPIITSAFDDSFEPPQLWKEARWNQIEQEFQPMLIEARGLFQDQVRDAPRDSAEWAKEHETSKMNIQGLAHDLYRDTIEQERQRLRRAREEVSAVPQVRRQELSPPQPVDRRPSAVTPQPTPAIKVTPLPQAASTAKPSPPAASFSGPSSAAKPVSATKAAPAAKASPPASASSSPPTGSSQAASASEWARRQEEQAQRQQEAFRLEQDEQEKKLRLQREEAEREEQKASVLASKAATRNPQPRQRSMSRSMVAPPPVTFTPKAAVATSSKGSAISSSKAPMASTSRAPVATAPQAKAAEVIPVPIAATPKIQPVAVLPTLEAEPDDAWKVALRKQIEDSLLPLVQEAKDLYSRKLNEGPLDQVTRGRLTNEHSQALQNIRRIADDLYRDQIDQERQQLKWAQGGTVERGWSEGIVKQQQAIIDNIARTREEEMRRSPVKEAVALPQALPVASTSNVNKREPAKRSQNASVETKETISVPLAQTSVAQATPKQEPAKREPATQDKGAHVESKEAQTPIASVSQLPTSSSVQLDVEPSDDWKVALRRRVEEGLLPALNEAREDFGRKFVAAPHNRAQWNNELDTAENELKRQAEDMFRDEIEVEKLRLQKGLAPSDAAADAKALQERIQAQIEKQRQERAKASLPGSPELSKRVEPSNQIAAPAKPPSPLTPPQTPKYGARYIGPVMVPSGADESPNLTAQDLKLTDEERKQEIMRFERLSLDIRKQKIKEFHDAAVALEFELAERCFRERPSRVDSQRLLARYEFDMEELKKTKERERREANDVERKRRVAELAARLQKPVEQESVRPMGGMGRQGPRGQFPASQARYTSEDPRALSNNAGPSKFAGSVSLAASQGPSNPSGLLFQNLGTRGFDAPQPSYQAATPMTPASRLPQIYSSDDEDGKQSFTSLSDVEERRHVRFSASVADDSSESDDDGPVIPRRRPRSNTVTSANHEQIRRPGGGRAPEPAKPAFGGQAAPEIWHPPLNNGKGKEQQQGFAPQETWRIWRG